MLDDVSHLDPVEICQFAEMIVDRRQPLDGRLTVYISGGAMGSSEFATEQLEHCEFGESVVVGNVSFETMARSPQAIRAITIFGFDRIEGPADQVRITYHASQVSPEARDRRSNNIFFDSTETLRLQRRESEWVPVSCISLSSVGNSELEAGGCLSLAEQTQALQITESD